MVIAIRPSELVVLTVAAASRNVWAAARQRGLQSSQLARSIKSASRRVRHRRHAGRSSGGFSRQRRQQISDESPGRRRSGLVKRASIVSINSINNSGHR